MYNNHRLRRFLPKMKIPAVSVSDLREKVDKSKEVVRGAGDGTFGLGMLGMLAFAGVLIMGKRRVEVAG